jgi:CheY-like chemotaxis protein
MQKALYETKSEQGMQGSLACVLLIDDYRPRISIFESFFECLQCTLDVASSASDALRKVAARRYNLVLVNLHRSDNEAITRAIREFERTTHKNPLEIVGIMMDRGLNDCSLNNISDLNDYIPGLISPHYMESKLHLSVVSRRNRPNFKKLS